MKHILILLFASLTHLAHADILWEWEDDFSNLEIQKLKSWIQHSDQGITRIISKLPFTYKVHFHRMNEGSGPCPWAHTSKGLMREVHFYVNTSHSKQKFIDDWTAPHEISHLLFPYLGEASMWFSEGIASYLQYQIMFANNTITWTQATDKLEERFNRARTYNYFDNISIVQLTETIRETHAYVRLYWGGAAYFMNVDFRLFKDRSIRLVDVIREYLDCCFHRNVRNADQMMELFNRVSETTLFTDVYRETVLKPGFPETKEALNWLTLNSPNIQSKKL